jgi:hypothetical protein
LVRICICRITFVHHIGTWRITKVVGLIWAADRFGIIFMQGPMLKWLEKHSPTKTLVYVGLIWAASWVLVAFCFVTPTIYMLPLQMTSSVVFGIGETTLVADDANRSESINTRSHSRQK